MLQVLMVQVLSLSAAHRGFALPVATLIVPWARYSDLRSRYRCLSGSNIDMVGMRGDFQRKGSACSNLGKIMQKQPSSANALRVRPTRTKAACLKSRRTATPRLQITSRDWRTTTMHGTLQSRTDPAARLLLTKKSTFCAA